MTEEQKYLLQQFLYTVRNTLRKLLSTNEILSSREKEIFNDRITESLKDFLEVL